MGHQVCHARVQGRRLVVVISQHPRQEYRRHLRAQLEGLRLQQGQDAQLKHGGLEGQEERVMIQSNVVILRRPEYNVGRGLVLEHDNLL